MFEAKQWQHEGKINLARVCCFIIVSRVDHCERPMGTKPNHFHSGSQNQSRDNPSDWFDWQMQAGLQWQQQTAAWRHTVCVCISWTASDGASRSWGTLMKWCQWSASRWGACLLLQMCFQCLGVLTSSHLLWGARQVKHKRVFLPSSAMNAREWETDSCVAFATLFSLHWPLDSPCLSRAFKMENWCCCWSFWHFGLLLFHVSNAVAVVFNVKPPKVVCVTIDVAAVHWNSSPGLSCVCLCLGFFLASLRWKIWYH